MVEVGDVVKIEDSTALVTTMPYESHRNKNVYDDDNKSREVDKSVNNFYKNDFSNFELLNILTESKSKKVEKNKMLPLI